MGRIRVSSFRRAETYQTLKPSQEKLDEIDPPEHKEHVEVRLDNIHYPIIPQKVNEGDLPFIPACEIMKQDGQGDSRLWIVVSKTVLDVTEYARKHPGGRSIIASFAGQDCTWQWYSFHDRSIWEGVAVGLRVGRTEGVQNPYERPPGIVGLRKLGFSDWD